MLEHGSQVDPVDIHGQTPLHKAAKRGDAETCQLLVSVALYECLFFKILLLLFMCILILYCLLYTSPSPRDRQKSRMPSSA